MEKHLQKTIEVASQIEEIISKKIPTGRKERTFWTTAVGIEEVAEMIRSNFEDAEKEICCVILDMNLKTMTMSSKTVNITSYFMR